MARRSPRPGTAARKGPLITFAPHRRLATLLAKLSQREHGDRCGRSRALDGRSHGVCAAYVAQPVGQIIPVRPERGRGHSLPWLERLIACRPVAELVMRLVDVVAQSVASDGLRVFGRRSLSASSMFDANSVTRCPVRYALDRSSSEQCIELVFASTGLPGLDDPLTRLPHDRFWLEMFASGADAQGRDRAGAGRRVGYLIDAEPGGRAGRIACFHEDDEESVSLLGGQVLFGQRHLMPRDASFRMRHPAAPQVAQILEHSVLHLHHLFAVAVAGSGPIPAAIVAQQAELGWTALPAILSFCAMLNDGAAIRARSVDRSQVNRARARRGRAPLLDHVEVTLNLDRFSTRDAIPAGISRVRSAPRLHVVRGHPVNRQGKTFWRASHLRGAGTEPVRRTVIVQGRSSRSHP